VPFELPVHDPCPFCRNVAGEPSPTSGPCAVIDRDELTFTFVQPARDYEVHLLVIPVRHAPTILDLTEEEATAIMRTTRRAAQALVSAHGAEGVNVYQNNGVASGQTVPHFHNHVVLRRPGDPWPPPPRVRIPPDERAEMAAYIRAHW
jgi:histidine triad (HIT) family protein